MLKTGYLYKKDGQIDINDTNDNDGINRASKDGESLYSDKSRDETAENRAVNYKHVF